MILKREKHTARGLGSAKLTKKKGWGVGEGKTRKDFFLSGFSGRRSNFFVAADCVSRTQTAEGFQFSEGKVSRAEGRVCAANLTRRHGRSRAAPTERKRKPEDVVRA